MAGSDTRFDRILDAVDADRNGPSRPAFINPLAGAAAPIGEGPRPASGTTGAWDGALAWIGDSAEGRDADFKGDDIETVAQELGAIGGLSLDQLARLRRRFMWAHHPDRCATGPRERANRRVAIANMLIDQARAALLARAG